MARRVLRPAGFDELGLRHALADRVLPLVVAAMSFLAALAIAGWVGAALLARHWEQGAGATLTVQVPAPLDRAGDEADRLSAAMAVLRQTPGVAAARALPRPELDALLRPWLGAAPGDLALPLPGVIAVRLSDASMATGPLEARLNASVPGTLVESHTNWASRVVLLARSIQACAGAALFVVSVVAAAMVAIATRAGLATRREAIEIVHGLGATDGYIASRFAARTTSLATAGGLVGGVAALPVLLAIARLAAPFTSGISGGLAGAAAALPSPVWMLLPGLPLFAAAIGFATAQATVRIWLRALP